MRWRGRLAVAAGALLLPHAPAAFAASTTSWTITGTRTGYTELTLAKRATFVRGSFSVTTSGGYAGFALWRDGTVVVAAVSPRAWLGDPLHAAPAAGHDVVLEPGRYRFYLLTDGRSKVTVRLNGRGPSRRVAVRHAVTSSGQTLDLGDAVTVAKRVRVDTGNRTFAMLALTYYADAAVAVRAATCFRHLATDDCDVTEFSTAAVNGTSSVGDRAVLWPGEVNAGWINGVFRAEGVTVGAHIVGFYLALDAT